ncbi:MAG: protease inhibitor I42 family protein [Synergistetes bacterium]|nr:protease inhibitor I42 family protein [Synergistota bacterium]
MRSLFTVSVMLFLTLIYGSAFAHVESSPNIFAFSERDSGKEVTASKGDVIVILLREASTAGYIWEVGYLDKNKLLFFKSDRVRLSPPGLLGGINLRVFFFKAMESGKASLRLIYHRPWEKLNNPAKIFSLFLLIK